MKIELKNFKLILLLLICSLNIKAQQYIHLPQNNSEINHSANDDKSNFSGFITSEIYNNWFISIESGVGTYSGEYYNKGDIRNRLGFISGFSMGKFVTPNCGFRLQFNSGQILGNKFPDIEGYKSNLEIFSVHADMLINISSACRGYKTSKCLDLMFYWGEIGRAHV